MPTETRAGFTRCSSGSPVTRPAASGARTRVVGVGSALVDILIPADDQLLERAGARRGGMALVDLAHIESVLARSGATPRIVPGGSACNTAQGVARLGGSARFVGKRGKDEMGARFEAGLVRGGVDPRLLVADAPTGRVLTLITSDAQRSMLTFLGASAEAEPAEMTPDLFDDAAVAHIEGYLLFNPELIVAAVAAARRAGARISLDLASYTVVETAGGVLDDLVRGGLDILIANEDEARAYTGEADEQRALAILAERAGIAVVKLGARGSWIRRGAETVRIPPAGDGRAVDTTGAGDLWAAGFLFGLVGGWSLSQSGRLGSLLGAEVCGVIGAEIPEAGWGRIQRAMETEKPL